MSGREEPNCFSVSDISNILGVSRSKTYELVCSDDCPFNAVKIGKRICIPANSFYKWYESLAGNEDVEGGVKQE